MCGILFFKNDPNLSYNSVLGEFNKIKYRGPDYSSLELINKYYMGFHRLSINGLDDKSNQPFIKKGVYCICNGEIYNFKDLYLESDLKQETNSDCEIIIDLYLKYPIEYFIKLLDGVFAFIIYDTHKNIIVGGRDPFGVRPLFFNSKNTAFSSELKAINMLVSDKITQFPPGHYFTYDKVFQIHKYHCIGNVIFNTNNYPLFSDEYGYYTSLIKTSLINSVKKRLLSDRPIACLLSGGLDSSLITSIVCKLLPTQKVETYSIGFKNSPDLKYAKIASQYLKTKHTEILVEEQDFLDAIPHVVKTVESYDTTTIRASVGNYLVSKYISEHSKAKVIFNGDGSDEITGGYLYFNKAPTSICFDNEIDKIMNNIHYFDVLRSDRTISSCGLEPRTPFLDKSFVSL